MGNLLLKYLDKRLETKGPSLFTKDDSGPVITISRQVGCNGLIIASLIAEKLNLSRVNKKWKVLSKEIFYESAKELNLDYKRISRIFKSSDKYTFEEILHAFGNKNYKTEQRIIRTVIDVIHSFAVEGNCIIVGRAAHIIAKNIKNALHLRLIAPLEYRINTIMKNNLLSRQQAIEFIKKVEKERDAFRKALGEEIFREEDFDLTLNRASFNNEEIVKLIENIITLKKMPLEQKNSILYF